jgi:hypothetical protein
MLIRWTVMTDNVLIPLPGFTLPTDYPWQINFVSAVEGQLRKLRSSGPFTPPRFFGYFFQSGSPIAVSGHWTVTLDLEPPLSELSDQIDELTQGRFSISSDEPERFPDFVLIHDRIDGACWLWRFAYGLQFVEATEPVIGGDDSSSFGSSGNQKLLGP